jgi:hypothetical protein
VLLALSALTLLAQRLSCLPRAESKGAWSECRRAKAEADGTRKKLDWIPVRNGDWRGDTCRQESVGQ